jgi:hypothetical protein
MAALLVRALRWRRGASLAVLAVAVVAAMAATLGPLYARSAEESFLLERVASAPPISTDVEVRATTIGQPGTPGQPRPDVVRLADSVTQAVAGRPGLDRWFGAATAWITVPPVLVSWQGGPDQGSARVSWHPGPCAGVRLVTGRCLAGEGEVIISDRMLAQTHLRLGATLRLGLTPPLPRPSGTPDPDVVTIVGTYALGSASREVWGPVRPAEFAEDLYSGSVQYDEILLDRTRMQASSGEAVATAFRLLRPDVTQLDEVDAAGRAAARDVDALTQQESAAIQQAPDRQPVWSARAGLPSFLADLADERNQLRVTSFATTAQLVLLSWFVLFLVVASTSEERAGELALAKLRGLGPWRTAAFGIAETAVLVAVGVPLGLLAALAVDATLVAVAPLPHTSAHVDTLTLAAGVAGLLGALVSAALALRRVVSTPVLDQLKRTGGTRAAVARVFAVDAVTLALAAEGIYLLSRGDGSPVALVAPGLLALATGLLAVRVLPLVARVAVRRSAASSRVATFLAVRNVARRPGGSRLVVLLTIATTLGVFSVSSWTISRDVRADRARQEVAAPTVLHVPADSPTQLLSLVDRADPSGRWAMAAAELSRSASGPVLGVETPRLSAVTTWDPSWAGTSFSGLTAALRPPVQPYVLVRDRLVLGVTARLDRGSPPVDLRARLQQPDGLQIVADLGRLRPAHEATYAASLDHCSAGCRLLGLVLQGQGLGNAYSAGSLTVTRVSDATGEVDARLSSREAWRVVPRSGQPGLESIDERTATPGPAGLDVRFAGLIAHDDVVVEVADHPSLPAALLGSDRNVDLVEGSDRDFVGTGLAGDSVTLRRVATGDLPRVGRAGTLVDLEYVAAADPGTWDGVDFQVWLAARAPAQVREALDRLGVGPGSVESLAERQAELGRDAASLALLLGLAAAVVAAVLAVGTVLAMSYVGGRRRSYELAALRSLGATTRVLVRAGRREQLLLVLVGTLLGAVVGVGTTVAALTALPAVTLAGIAPAVRGPRLLPVVAVVLAVLALVAVVAHLGSRRVVTAARADLLRENQA